MESSLIDTFLPQHKLFSRLVNEGKRNNDRQMNEPLPLELQRHVFPELVGSASVRRDGSYYFGDVSAALGLRSKYSSNILSVKVQVPSISGADFGLQKRSEGSTMKLGEDFEQNLNGWVEAVALQVERCLGACLKQDAFVIEHGNIKYVWHLNVRVTCLSYSGNLIDSVFLCALLSLLDLRLPSLTWDSTRRWWRADGMSAVWNPPNKMVEAFQYIPISISVHTLETHRFLDADLTESKSGVPKTLIYFLSTEAAVKQMFEVSRMDWIQIASPITVTQQPEIEFNQMLEFCRPAAEEQYNHIFPHLQ